MSTAQYNPDIAPAAPMANEQQMYGDAEGNHNEVRYGNLRESHNIAPAPANHAPAPASAFISKEGEEVHKDTGMAGSANVAGGNKEGKEAKHTGSFAALQGRTYTSGSGLPAEPQAIMDQTPDMWFREHQGKLQAEETAQEEERLRALKQKKEESKGGIGYKVGKFFSNTSAAVGKSVNEVSDSTGAKAHESNMKQAKARLAKYWPGHNADQLIAEFDCEGLHYNMPIRGHVLLTPHSLLFMGKGKNELVIVEDIFLSDIVSYSKGVSVPCIEHGARWVMDLPNQIVQPDAIQIFTRNGMHFDFINISHSMKDFHDGHENVSVFDRFINYFDHAWRAAKI